MNVLLVEDRGTVAYPLVEALEERGHTVFLAPNITRAKYYCEKKKVDCIIVDLNMDPEGLSRAEMNETKGGVLTGWVWLKTCVLAERPFMTEQTIILTAYERELRAEVDPAELGRIPILSKRPLLQTPVAKIVEHVETIGKRLRNEARDEDSAKQLS